MLIDDGLQSGMNLDQDNLEAAVELLIVRQIALQLLELVLLL